LAPANATDEGEGASSSLGRFLDIVSSAFLSSWDCPACGTVVEGEEGISDVEDGGGSIGFGGGFDGLGGGPFNMDRRSILLL
jgi:hypothetical protein